MISICSHSSNAPIFDHKTIRFFSQCQHVVQNRRRFSFLSRPNLCHLIRLTSYVYFTYYIPETCCRSNKTEKPDSIVSVEFLHRFVYRNSKSRLSNRLPVFIYLHHETLIQAFSFDRSTRFFFPIVNHDQYFLPLRSRKRDNGLLYYNFFAVEPEMQREDERREKFDR